MTGPALDIVLTRIAEEIRASRLLLPPVEEVLGLALTEHDPISDQGFAALQGIDLLSQRLDNLAQVITAIAPSGAGIRPPESALRGIQLAALRQALTGRSGPASPHDTDIF